MNAAQKLAKRAEKRERQIGRAWTAAAAAAAGMSPKQFADACVFVYPRDYQGPITDDERVEMVRDGWRAGMKMGGGAN